jgi:hypothetical protein
VTRAVVWQQLHDEARLRGLKVAVERIDRGDGTVLRIRLRDRTANRWSSSVAAPAGPGLDQQAELMIDALRRSPR